MKRKPHSEACERNKQPILEVLQKILGENQNTVFEVGAGTGQHAVYFAPKLQGRWIASDVKGNHAGIRAWLKEAGVSQVEGPTEYKVGQSQLPPYGVDVVYTANTFHIMPWKTVKTLIKDVGQKLKENGLFIIYGPFNYEGRFTSPSNEEFDRRLKDRDSLQGIRAFEDVSKAMNKNLLELVEDVEMPANNRILIFKKLRHPKQRA